VTGIVGNEDSEGWDRDGGLMAQLRVLLRGERKAAWLFVLLMTLLFAGSELLAATSLYLLMAVVVVPDAPVRVPLIGIPLEELAGGSEVAERSILLVAIGAFFLLRAVLLIAVSYATARLTAKAGYRVSKRLFRGYLAMPFLMHTRRNSAELVRNTFTATQQLAEVILVSIVLLITDGLVAAAMLGLMLVVDARATLLATLVIGSALFLIQGVLRPRLRRWGRATQVANTDSIRTIQESLTGIRDLKLLQRTDTFAESHETYRRRLAVASYRSQAASAVPRAAVELFLVAAIIGVFVLLDARADAPGQGLAVLGLFAYVALRLQPVVQRMTGHLNRLRFHGPLVADLADEVRMLEAGGSGVDGPFVGLIPEPRQNALRSAEGSSADDAPFRRILFDNVSFAYPSASSAGESSIGTQALTGVNLSIGRGEFVGVVGPTGGGKSTLLDVLVGLLPPTTGRVMIDERPLGDEPAWWWEQLGVVSQQVFLTDGTLLQNIAFGDRKADIDTSRALRSLRLAHLDEFVQQLPEGLATTVGERGIRLSGGQRQRIAIARALYRNPQVLVLDEGTSALDSATEAAVMAAIEAQRVKRTLIVVAHRLSTVRRADRIVLLQDGRVQAEGTYEELHETSAAFRALSGAG
jgi:ABC-type multidrug transport system fused ATPase/permease subunit